MTATAPTAETLTAATERARLNEVGDLLPLTADEFKQALTTLRPKYPQDFTVTSAQARAWREQQIGECMKEGNWSGVEFHRNWLIAEMVTGGR